MNRWTEPATHRGRLPRSGAVGEGVLAAVIAVFTALIATGCASAPAPADAVAASVAAIAQADRSGAQALAPTEMRAAREKLARVDLAMAARDYRHALWFAQEAQLDAELAEIKAWSARATVAARNAKATQVAP